MTLTTCIYSGDVFHRRFRPSRHVLRYRVFSLLIDLDELDRLDRELWLFSRNRFNLVSFHDRDFGDGTRGDLRQWINSELVETGIDTRADRILLSCYPRILGYAFNPLSLFYCLDASGAVFAVIHEVHNTFGERHAYVLPATEQGTTRRWIEQTTDKALFVSPFAHMNLRYRFRLNRPEQRQVVLIRASEEQGLLLTASYVAERRVLTSRTLLAELRRIPMMRMKVILGIHFEALKLWIKRVPHYTHQPKASP